MYNSVRYTLNTYKSNTIKYKVFKLSYYMMITTYIKLFIDISISCHKYA